MMSPGPLKRYFCFFVLLHFHIIFILNCAFLICFYFSFHKAPAGWRWWIGWWATEFAHFQHHPQRLQHMTHFPTLKMMNYEDVYSSSVIIVDSSSASWEAWATFCIIRFGVTSSWTSCFVSGPFLNRQLMFTDKWLFEHFSQPNVYSRCAGDERHTCTAADYSTGGNAWETNACYARLLPEADEEYARVISKQHVCTNHSSGNTCRGRHQRYHQTTNLHQFSYSWRLWREHSSHWT